MSAPERARTPWSSQNAKLRPSAEASPLPRSLPCEGQAAPEGLARRGGAGRGALRGGAREGRRLLRPDLSDGDGPGLRWSPHQASTVLAGLRTTPAAPHAQRTPHPECPASPLPCCAASRSAPHALRIPAFPEAQVRVHSPVSLPPTPRAITVSKTGAAARLVLLLQLASSVRCGAPEVCARPRDR